MVRRPPAFPPASVVLAPRRAAQEANPREQRIARLRDQVIDILRGPPLSRLRVGLHVMEAESGDVLLAYHPDGSFNPASNTKILTTAAAMHVLGSDWSYRTVLLAGPERQVESASLHGAALAAPAPGTFRGDLFLQGSGDPTLDLSALGQIAHGLVRAGITRVEGDLITDGKFRALKDLEEGRSEGVGEGALIVNRNVYKVQVSPSSQGQLASVSLEPRTSYLVLSSQVRTVKGKRARIFIDHYRKDGRLYVSVRGRIGERHGVFSDKRRMPDGAAFAAVGLKDAMADFGVELSGQVRFAPPPPGPLSVVAEHRSPLFEACKISNKDSNNFVADMIFKTLGGERFGLPGTLEKGVRAVMEWLPNVGIDPGRIKIVNGSGLSRENRLRPDDLAHLLRSLYHDIRLAPEFLQSLAVGGIDGTIRHRFRGSTVGLVRAKTGTLDGVSALSGYVGERQGVLIFSIMVEGFRPKRLDEVRHAQVRIVESLMRFLRSDMSAPPPEPLLAPAPVEERDSESDGDPT